MSFLLTIALVLGLSFSEGPCADRAEAAYAEAAVPHETTRPGDPGFATADAHAAVVAYGRDCEEAQFFVAFSDRLPVPRGQAPSVEAAVDSVVAALVPSGAAALRWSPASLSGPAGSRLSADLVLSGASYDGLQVDLSGPAGAALTVRSGPGSQGAQFASRTLPDGTVRAVLYGHTLSEGAAVLTVSFDAAAGEVTTRSVLGASPTGAVTSIPSAALAVSLDRRGDLTADGLVTVADVVALVDVVLLRTAAEPGVADVNRDGNVDVGDVVALARAVADGAFPDGGPLPSALLRLRALPAGPDDADGHALVSDVALRAVDGRVPWGAAVSTAPGVSLVTSRDGTRFVAYALGEVAAGSPLVVVRPVSEGAAGFVVEDVRGSAVLASGPVLAFAVGAARPAPLVGTETVVVGEVALSGHGRSLPWRALSPLGDVVAAGPSLPAVVALPPGPAVVVAAGLRGPQRAVVRGPVPAVVR